MTEDLAHLQQRMKQLSDEELLRMVTQEAHEYRKDALDAARKELDRRRVSIPEDGEDDAATPLVLSSSAEIEVIESGREPNCRDCGGKLRWASLQAGSSQLLLSFFDTGELRYLDTSVCLKCGKVTFKVDFESEVS